MLEMNITNLYISIGINLCLCIKPIVNSLVFLLQILCSNQLRIWFLQLTLNCFHLWSCSTGNLTLLQQLSLKFLTPMKPFSTLSNRSKSCWVLDSSISVICRFSSQNSILSDDTLKNGINLHYSTQVWASQLLDGPPITHQFHQLLDWFASQALTLSGSLPLIFISGSVLGNLTGYLNYNLTNITKHVPCVRVVQLTKTRELKKKPSLASFCSELVFCFQVAAVSDHNLTSTSTAKGNSSLINESSVCSVG